MPTGVPLGGSKVVNIGALTAVTLDVWATVTGTDGTSTNDGLQSANMSFLSTGPVLGTMAATPTPSPNTPWNASGSQSGASVDLDGDTDLDLGSTNTALAAGWWIARAGSVQSNGTGTFMLGKVTFTPANFGAATNLNVALRNVTNGALWFEDATVNTVPDPDVWTNDKNPSTGSYAVGAPVVLTVAVVGSPNTWGSTGGGLWGTASNWSDGSVPASGANVTFGGAITAPSSVTVNGGGRTVGGLLFNNANAYSLTGVDTLTVNGGSTINVVAGSHGISAPLALNGVVTKTGAGDISISGTQTPGVGASLVLDAANTGAVNMSSDPAGLGVTVNGGTLNFANGTAAYNVSSLNVDENAANALVNIPGGAAFQTELVVITPTVAPTRADDEAVATDLAYGRFVGTSGISTAHAGHDPLTNVVQQFTDGTSIYLFETIEGDCNGDGITDATDIGIGAGFQDVPAGTGPAAAFTIFTQMEGDWNADFLVDATDIGIMAGRQDVAYNPAQGPGGVSAVPEPASLGLLAIGASGLLRRRRRI